MLNDKNGNKIVIEDHSALKKLQEFERHQAENSRKILQPFNRPDLSKGETLKFFVDDVYPFKKIECEPAVPQLLEPNEDKGEHLLVISDEIPFLNQDHPTKIQKKP